MMEKKKSGNFTLITMIVLLIIQVLVSYEDLINSIVKNDLKSILWFGVPTLLLSGAIIFNLKDRFKIKQ